MSNQILSGKGKSEQYSRSDFIVFLVGDESKAMRKALSHSFVGEMKVIHVIDPDEIKLSNRSVLMIDHTFDRPTLNLVSKGLAQNIPLVIGSCKKLPDKIWDMKTVAQARGSIFEIATSHEDYSFRIGSTLRAIHSRWRHPIKKPSTRFEWISELPLKTIPAPEHDDLASLPGVNKATQLLRSESGRLDAEEIRTLFGLTRKDLASLIGTSAEAIRQTPDSKNLQTELLHFERIARLLVLLKPDVFRKWLNAPNDELDGHPPIEFIKEKRWEVIENLVADILENRGR